MTPRELLFGLGMGRSSVAKPEGVRTVLYPAKKKIPGWWLGHPSEKYESQLG